MSSQATTARPASAGDGGAYLEARRYAAGFMRHVVEARNAWQRAFVAQSIVSIILVLALASLALKSRTVPYVVEVDAFGQVRSVGIPEAAKSETWRERVLNHELRQFVSDLRTITTDPSAQLLLRSRAYVHVTPSLRHWLDDYFQKPENDSRLIARHKRRAVTVQSVLPAGEDTYQVEWIETLYRTADTRELARSHWTALLTLQHATDISEQLLEVNPTGLFITELNWTRKSTSKET